MVTTFTDDIRPTNKNLSFWITKNLLVILSYITVRNALPTPSPEICTGLLLKRHERSE